VERRELETGSIKEEEEKAEARGNKNRKENIGCPSNTIQDLPLLTKYV